MIEGARPEVELACRAVTPSDADAVRAPIETLLGADLDWEFLLEFVRHHGVGPAVHDRLVGGYGSRLPPEVRAALDRQHRSRTVENLRMATALHELFDRFADEGVRALPVKGPVLAEAAHGSLSRRSFNDLDLQIHRADVPRALDVMESLGYERVPDVPRRDDAAILGGPLTPPLATEYTLRRPADGVAVEVGWRFGSDPFSFAPGFETFWDRRESVSVAGRTVPALAPADRLLLLAYHCVKHGCVLLKWIADVAEAVHATPGLDWRALSRRAEEYGTARRLTVALGVATRLLDADGPPVGEWLADDPAAAALVDRVHGRFVDRPLAPFESVDTVDFLLAASDSGRAKALTRLALSPVHPTLSEYRLLPLPGPLHPVYYLLRPLRLLLAGVRSTGTRPSAEG